MATKAKKKKTCPYETITNQVIKLIEKGVNPWRKTWQGSGVPTSGASNKPYDGLNAIWLDMLKHTRDYDSNKWVTFPAIKKNGGVIEKDKWKEHCTYVNFWKKIQKKDKDGNKLDDFFMMLRTYKVINLSCVEFPEGMPTKWEEDEELEENTAPPLEVAEELVKKYLADNKGLTLQHGGDRAFYMPSRDMIQMPKREDFEGNPEYYSTIFHEMGHSTGHKTRLDRDGITGMNFFGSHEYSKEELVAEFTACFLCSHVGIEDTRENSASYLKGWVSKLKDEPKMLMQASTKAKQATKYILGTMEVEAE